MTAAAADSAPAAAPAAPAEAGFTCPDCSGELEEHSCAECGGSGLALPYTDPDSLRPVQDACDSCSGRGVLYECRNPACMEVWAKGDLSHA